MKAQENSACHETVCFVQGKMDEIEEIANMWQAKHGEIEAELRITSDKCHQNSVQADEYQKDLESTKLQLEEAKKTRASTEAEAVNLKAELAASQSDVEQLKSLAQASNRMQADLESRMATQAASMRAVESSLQQARDECKQKHEELEGMHVQLGKAKQALLDLDEMRDKLQVGSSQASAIFRF